MRPCTGQAAASPSAQIVWPSIWGGDLEQHVDLALVRPAFRHPRHDAPQPAGAFAAWRALAAALVPVEIRDAGDGADDVGRLVHHDDRRRAEARLKVLQRVEIHRRVDDLVGRNQWHRRAAGDHSQQVIPTAADAAAMPVDQLAEWDRHHLFDVTRRVDVPGDAEELRAGIVFSHRSRRTRRPRAARSSARLRSTRRC